jgi:hypothetical protein
LFYAPPWTREAQREVSNDATFAFPTDGQPDGTPTVANFMPLFDGARHLEATVLITLRCSKQKPINEAFDENIYMFFFAPNPSILSFSFFSLFEAEK